MFFSAIRFSGPSLADGPLTIAPSVPGSSERRSMVNRPVHMNAFEFVLVSALRAQQLLAGCVSRKEGSRNAPTMAQMEVASGCVSRSVDGGSGPTCRWQL